MSKIPQDSFDEEMVEDRGFCDVVLPSGKSGRFKGKEEDNEIFKTVIHLNCFT